MSTTNEFYRTRAEEARRDALEATLENVRERHLTAAAAWDVMAERGERTLRKRAETDARKAAALADAAAADLLSPPMPHQPPREDVQDPA